MRLVNTITFFRIVSFPVLVFLLFTRNLEVFKWLIVAGFLTDALDGFLARKLKAQSILGARFDSIGDDLTVLAAILGLFVFQPEFLRKEWLIITILLILFFIQTGYAFLKYQKMTSFHTYGAKLAAVFQGLFLCSMFFFKEPAYWLFYSTVILTGLELIEEISMVYVLRNWKSDVRGLYWAIQIKKERDITPHPQD